MPNDIIAHTIQCEKDYFEQSIQTNRVTFI